MKSTNSKASFTRDVAQWAQQQFGDCDLGDVRRTQRLVEYAARQATEPEASTHAVCAGDDAVAEGIYRWMRNSAIDPKAVDEGPFQATAAVCGDHELILAIQDTTTITFSHALASQLGSVGEVEGHHVGGIVVHSTLMVDAQTREPLGLIDQERWSRPVAPVGKPKRQKETQHRKKRAYVDKESVKWEQATRRMNGRLGDASHVITVCDREADIYDYVTYLVDQGQRFVLRAGQDRCLLTPNGHLFDLMTKQPVFATRSVKISQRGAQRATPKQKKRESRSARTATMSIRKAIVELARPANRRDGPESIRIGVVYLQERNAPKGETPAEWLLLTRELIATRAQVNQVVSYYECRWLIEEFHKAWKTGCRVEQRRFQSLDNTERFLAVTAPIAVRILQLRTLAQLTPDEPCSAALSRAHWQCLSAKLNPTRSIPKRPPTLHWAMVAIAKLGGWRDTKQTGRIGWQTLWRGWSKLEDLVEGWSLAQRA